MTRALQIIVASAVLFLSFVGDAAAQVVVEDEKKPASTTSGSPMPATSGRVGALLGGLGAPVTEPAKAAEAPEVPSRTHDRMSRCFQDATKREVQLPGRVEVEITLLNFAVTGVTLADGASMDLLLRECIQAAAKATDVTAKDGSYTWLFIPSSG